MTSSKPATTDWPVPLKAKQRGLGQAVSEFVRETEATHDEAAAYARARSLARAPAPAPLRQVRTVAAGLAVALLGVVAGTAIYRRAAHVRGPHVAGSPADRPEAGPRGKPASVPVPAPSSLATPAPAPARLAVVRLASTPVTLPPGQVEVAGQATVVLAADAVASARSQANDTEIALEQGKIDFDVRPRSPGHGFSVRADHYRFSVVGTAFTVTRTSSRLALVVREGTVAVSRGEEYLATVHGGQSWSVDLSHATAPSRSGLRAAELPMADEARPSRVTAPVATATPPGFAPPPAPSPATPLPVHAAEAKVPTNPAAGRVTAGSACADPALGRQPREALACYQERAKQNGLAGETAEYEMGRLWRDVFGDLPRALAVFQEQRARFPNGALRIEADLSIIELLPRLGRHDEALAESERFLSSHPTSERRWEIYLLRGNIFREGMHDLRRAEREYALGTGASGRIGDDCRFLHAVAVEALGRTDEARREYAAYLLHRGGAHTADAKQRLDHLPP